jgi:UDP-glucose 4-epimerase
MLSEEPNAVGETFNIGNPDNKVTINALANKIKKMTGSKSTVRHISYEKAYEKGFEDMRHREPDISKLRKFVDFSPEVTIDEMLAKVIKDIKRK